MVYLKSYNSVNPDFWPLYFSAHFMLNDHYAKWTIPEKKNIMENDVMPNDFMPNGVSPISTWNHGTCRFAILLRHCFKPNFYIFVETGDAVTHNPVNVDVHNEQTVNPVYHLLGATTAHDQDDGQDGKPDDEEVDEEEADEEGEDEEEADDEEYDDEETDVEEKFGCE